MRDVGYYNGKIGPIGEMSVPMNDRAVYFGDGVYDATYAGGRAMYEADEHIARFYRNASELQIPPPMPPGALKRELQACLDLMDEPRESMVYWQISRGTAPRTHAFPDAPPNLMITVRPVSLVNLARPMRLITCEDIRSLRCDIKSLNLIPAVLASQRAKEMGCQEAVFHRGGRVTECAHSNVHILKGGALITAPADNLILPGITRAHVMGICRRLGIPVREVPFTLPELLEADEILVTSAGTLCAAARQVDGRDVGGKAPELLRKLQQTAVSDFASATGYTPDILSGA